MNKEHGEMERKFSTHIYSLWLDENCECVCVCDFGPLCAYSTTLHNMQCILMLLWNFKWTNGWTHITRKFQWFSGPSNKSCMVADEWMRTWYYSIARCPPALHPPPTQRVRASMPNRMMQLTRSSLSQWYVSLCLSLILFACFPYKCY